MKHNRIINKSRLFAVSSIMVMLIVVGFAISCGSGPDEGTPADMAWTRANQHAEHAKDICGAWISKERFEDYEHEDMFGWEVDYVDPDGGNEDSNLRPLHYRNNAAKADSIDPDWICARGERIGLPPY